MIRFIFLISLFFTLIISCKPKMAEEEDTAETMLDRSEGAIMPVENNLEGTWQLLAAKFAHVGEGESDEYNSESNIIALKLFTKNRFVALRFSKDDHLFLGSSGGSYIQLGDEFREYIEYNTWDSTLIKTPQTFNCTFEGNLLTQSGFIKGGAQPDQNLEEVYERIEPGITSVSDRHPITGSWNLANIANGDVTEPQPLPENEKAFKIMTPAHYLVARYRNTGALVGLSYGTYEITPDYYTETIECYSYDPSAAGKKYIFNWSIEGNQFKQTGFIDSDLYMDYKIEEYYTRE